MKCFICYELKENFWNCHLCKNHHCTDCHTKITNHKCPFCRESFQKPFHLNYGPVNELYSMYLLFLEDCLLESMEDFLISMNVEIE